MRLLRNRANRIGNLSFDSILKYLTILLVIVFIISLLPILYASVYARPALDDFGYSLLTHDAISNGEGLPGVLSAAWQTVYKNYFEWQGTYSAIFLFALQPGIWGYEYYFITTFVMLGMLILGTCFFVNTLITKILHERRIYATLISTLILLLSVQFIPNEREAFYWWNGSVYYTFFYGLQLVFFSLLIRMHLARNQVWKNTLFGLCLLLAFIISGGNYSTGLFCFEILSLVCLWLFIKNRVEVWRFIAIDIVLIVFFIISIVAPGNSVRASMSNGMNPIAAVITSIVQFFLCSLTWTGTAQILYLVMITPVLYYLAKRSRFSFRYPAIAVALIFLLCASQMTPAYYALSAMGGYRQIDLYSYSYYLMITLSCFYLAGYVSRKAPAIISLSELKKLPHPKSSFIASCLIVAILGAGFWSDNLIETTFGQTVYHMIKGNAAQYVEEYNAQLEDIASCDGICYTPSITTLPPFLSPLGITPNPDYWTNKQVSDFFHIDAIILKTE